MTYIIHQIHLGKKKKDRSKKQIETEEREKMRVLVSNFTEEQLDSLEDQFFPKQQLKELSKLLQETLFLKML